MLNKPVVSLVIICKNSSTTIVKCLEEALSGVDGEVEILCVDRGSTDNTLSAVREIAYSHDAIRIISCSDITYGSAVVAGARFAEGDYCCFVDACDVVSGAVCAKLARECRDNGFPSVAIAQGAGFVETPGDDFIVQNCFHGVTGELSIRDDSFNDNNDSMFGCCLYSAGLFKTTYILQSEALLVSNDLSMMRHNISWFLLIKAAETMIVSESTLYYVRLVDATRFSACALKNELRCFLRELESPVSCPSLAQHFTHYVRASLPVLVSSALGACFEIRADERGSYLSYIRDMFEPKGRFTKALDQVEADCDCGMAYHELRSDPKRFFYTRWYKFEENLQYEASAKWCDRELARERSKINKLQSENERLQSTIKKLRKSNSYRVGRAVTAIPRAVKRLLRRANK